MAYMMKTGMGARLANVLPNTDPINGQNNTKPDRSAIISRTSVPGEKDGVKGRFISTTTRNFYDGSGGGTGSGTIKPKKTYEEFAAEGGDVKAAIKWNAANPRTPNRHKDITETEFLGRVDSHLTPQGIVPQKEIPAKIMPTPTSTVTVKRPPRPAWETGKPPKKRRSGGGGGGDFKFKRGRSSGIGNRTFGTQLKNLFKNCKTC